MDTFIVMWNGGKSSIRLDDIKVVERFISNMMSETNIKDFEVYKSRRANIIISDNEPRGSLLN